MRWLIVLLSLLFLEAGGQRPPRPAMDGRLPATVDTAVFSMGCFWGVEARYGAMPGVLRTEVGYAGGRTRNPTYDEIGDSSESVRITYDPSQVSYEELLEVFWDGTHPFRKPYKRQYRSAILWQNQTQKQSAQKSRPEGEVYTAIEPLDVFYLAEDYHQKYHLQQTLSVYKEFRQIYPDDTDFIRSTAAARVNGYLGGYGTPEGLERDLPHLGLSEKGQKVLRDNKPRPKCGG